jgi:hypothetical protein
MGYISIVTIYKGDGTMQTVTEPICKRAGCGKPAIPIEGRRKKEYCSDACRQKDYRNRKRDATGQEIERLRAQLQIMENQLSEEPLYIAELEDKVQKLQAQSNFEECLRADTQVRHFKSWLRKQPQPRDTDFSKRFLADSRLPQHGSRALYEAKLRAYNYSAEDISLFRDLWLTLMLEQA